MKMVPDQLKSIIEGLLFVSGSDGVTLKQIESILQLDHDRVKVLLNELKTDYLDQSRGIQIVESDDRFYLTSKPDHSDYFKKLMTETVASKLTNASLETLAIIAYNQPITRVEIEEVRGVKSDRPVQTLLSRGLIEEVGKKDSIGRPMMFGTTLDFLTYFGLKSIDELPPLIDKINTESLEEESSLYFEQLNQE